MTYTIRMAKLTGLKTGKEWHKNYVGNYYAVYSSPFEEKDAYFGGTYLVYAGIGSSISCRIHKENLELVSNVFLSDALETKQKELGIDIKYDYASEKAFLLVTRATEEVLDSCGVFRNYFAAHQYVEKEENLKDDVYIKEVDFIR